MRPRHVAGCHPMLGDLGRDTSATPQPGTSPATPRADGSERRLAGEVGREGMLRPRRREPCRLRLRAARVPESPGALSAAEHLITPAAEEHAETCGVGRDPAGDRAPRRVARPGRRPSRRGGVRDQGQVVRGLRVRGGGDPGGVSSLDTVISASDAPRLSGEREDRGRGR